MRKTQRVGIKGRGRRARSLADDPRKHRDPQATSLGDGYEPPLSVRAERGRQKLILRFDSSSFRVGPDGEFQANKYAETFGDGVASTFTIRHGLGSRVLTSVQVYELSSGDVYVPDVTFTDVNTVDLDFGATVPTANQYRVVVTA